MIPKRILDILTTTVSETPQLPATIIFNEGWMLRLMLDALAQVPALEHRLAFEPHATWYSEALLPSAFRPRNRADALSESYTHADAGIGHINVAKSGDAYLRLAADATQFIITEAKMFGGLSSGVKNAPFFDQAARNVACMAEVLRRADASPEQFTSIGLYILAPQVAIEAGVFAPFIERTHIEGTVAQRVRAYGGELDEWFSASFRPLIERIDLECISWEELLRVLGNDAPNAAELGSFYQNCVKYNQPRETAPSRNALAAQPI
jgi:hypothetical protein